LRIDLGYLGTVVLEDMEQPFETEEGFTVVMDGFTESGVRVHGVVDKYTWQSYPCVWKNAILIDLEV
jgi:hypothetical protein